MVIDELADERGDDQLEAVGVEDRVGVGVDSSPFVHATQSCDSYLCLGKVLLLVKDIPAEKHIHLVLTVDCHSGRDK